MNDKLQLSSTQIPNIILDEWMSLLTPSEFKVVMTIARQTYGWHKDTDRISYSQIIEKTGYEKEAVATALKALRLSGKIVVTDADGNQLHTIEECRGKSLHYRLNLQTSSKIEQVDKKKFENRTSKIEHTKETNTKENIKSKDLIQGNPDVVRILEEFSEITGFSKPTDAKPRQWAYLYAKHIGTDTFRACLTYPISDKKYDINKMETVYRKFPVYEAEVLNKGHRSGSMTDYQKELKEVMEGMKL